MQNFETSLKTLETLVAKMETGKLSLNEAMQCFEQGVALTASCQKMLKEAEQRILSLADAQGLPLNSTSERPQTDA